MNTPLAQQALEALEDCINAVEVFHGPDAWDIYRDHSPEMKRWQAALAALRSHIDQPAAREPLSDEQIDDLLGEANRGFCIERYDYFKAFRDAEAAHGIHPSNGVAHD